MSPLVIIIPSKNPSNLRACLNALRENDQGFRIVVPWSASPEQSAELLQSFPYLKFVEVEQPFIFARAINLGICASMLVPIIVNQANPQWFDFLLLNDDAILQSEGGFSRMHRELDAHPEFGLMSAATNNVGNPNMFLRGNPAVQHDFGEPKRWIREDPRMVCFVACLIPGRTIQKVGLLDERFCVDYGLEDDDYCLRVRRAGLKIGIYDGCFVDHSSLPSTYRAPGGPGEKGFQGNLKVFKEKWGAGNMEL